MRRGPRPIIGFRRRLLGLIEERFAGRYTALARRAGVPVSTMEHYIHLAKRLPGGEHLLRLAEALDVSVQYLVSGEHAVRPTVILANPGPGAQLGASPSPPRTSRSRCSGAPVRMPARWPRRFRPSRRRGRGWCWRPFCRCTATVA